MNQRTFSLLLGIILGLCGLMRFTNLNWDAGKRLHPDEGLIVSAASKMHWFRELNPHFHDYNGFSVYLLSAATTLTPHPSLESMTLLGRYLSASISFLTVVLFYVLCIRIFPSPIALMITAAFAFSPLLIQLAHFYTTDSIIVCFFVLILLTLYTYIHKPTVKHLILLSVPVGLSIATKNTGYLFLPLPFFSILFSKRSLREKVLQLTFCVVTVLGIFFITSPYSFIDLWGYLDVSRTVSWIVSGAFKPDWALQFQDTTPLYWFIQTLYAFGPLAILGLISAVWILRKNTIVKDKSFIVPVATWTIGFATFLACTYLKFTRYSAPLIPVYSLSVGYLLLLVRKQKILLKGIGLLLITHIIYGVMFFSIYTTPHTTLQATQWLGENLSTNATVLREEWNYIIQYNGKALMDKHLYIDSLNFYTTPDNAQKLDAIIEKIRANDYITLDSPKVRNTTRRLYEKYPYTSTFYALLENGALGFTKVAEFTDYPRIGPIVLNDEYAEETFTSFDHPAVRIYKKQRQIIPNELYLMLTSGIR